jgi:hypothetical protein
MTPVHTVVFEQATAIHHNTIHDTNATLVSYHRTLALLSIGSIGMRLVILLVTMALLSENDAWLFLVFLV